MVQLRGSGSAQPFPEWEQCVREHCSMLVAICIYICSAHIFTYILEETNTLQYSKWTIGFQFIVPWWPLPLALLQPSCPPP